MRHQRLIGFTLTEYLLYIAMAVIILLVATEAVLNVLEQRVKLEVMADVSQNFRIIMHRISLAVRNADAIILPAPSSTGSVLTLQMANPAVNPTTFSVQNGMILMKEGGSATSTLTSGGSTMSLRFTNMTPNGTQGTILVEMAGQGSATGTRTQFQFHQTASTTASIRRSP